ncbi:hypothetical protein G5C51_23450 [Streptomyces sp. A7024]|uniref:Glycosyltransferase RgtA/B/C/D-like domain-containing protein n=1 Tax=Streptomyces coryli TaxID=1128680 RepID=A0A6G4U3L8_9ACTN|nr:glycosyltransferase family 39 protein [Streptomyces coryli]NGN66849.1 hypothetical protein [Streptomyces coryli]
MAIAQHSRLIAPQPTTARPGAPDAPERLPLAAVVLIPLALALTLGLWGLGRQGAMWRDEAVTYDMAQRSLPELLRTLEHYDAVHGLYYLVVHGVFAVFGDGLIQLRLPSLLAVAAAAAGVAVLGRRLAGPGAGLAAGVIFPLLPDAQRYAQEGRSYALVCAGVVWATVLLLHAAEARRAGAWAGYGAVLLGTCLVHEFAVLALVAHGVALCARRAPAGVLRAWGAAVGCVAVGLAPLAAYSTGQAELVAWIGGPSWRIWVGFAVVVTLGVGCAAVARGQVAAVALPLLLAPKVTLLLMSLARPLYVERYVFHTSAGLALLLGGAAHALWQRRGLVRMVAAVVAAVSAIVLAVPVGQQIRAPESRKDDLAAVAAAVRANAAPGDGLLFTPARRRVWKLPGGSPYDGLNDLAQDRSPRASRTLYGTELPPSAIRTRMLGERRIIVLHDRAREPLDQEAAERVKRATLRAHFERCAGSEVHGGRVTLYARPGAC